MADAGGPWTDAEAVVYTVFRDVGAWSPASTITRRGQTATVAYRAQTLSPLDGTVWVAALAFHAAATDLGTPPTGMVNRIALVSTDAVAAHDTNGGRVSNWPESTVGVNAAGKWATATVAVPSSPSYVTAAAAMGDTLAIPAGVLVGDLIIAQAVNTDSDIVPTMPTGWTNIVGTADNLNTIGQRVAYLFATATVGDFAPQIWHI